MSSNNFYRISLSVDFRKPHIDILYKLWRNRCFGKGHMLIDNVLRGFPKDKKDNKTRVCRLY